MEENARPRDWSPNWGIAVFFMAVAASAVSGKLFKEGKPLVASLIESGTLLACVAILARLGPSRRRYYGAFATPLSVVLLITEAFDRNIVLGWWARLLVMIVVMTALHVPLTLWLLRRDRVRAAG